MKNCRLNNKLGIASIVEVIVSAIIFATAAFGILTAITDLRPEGVESSKKLEAMLKAKGKLDELRRQNHPDLWNEGGDLYLGDHSETDGTYTYEWTVTDIAEGTDLSDYARKVDFTITY